jgi:hypothetical protein
MKVPGFEEEKEWRLIFTPPADVQPKLRFHPRRDFLAPHIELAHLWYDLRPRMLAIPTLRATVRTQLPAVTAPPLIPITQLMIGPSGHQSLNVRAFTKLFIQAKRETVTILQSRIPYRSLS